MQSVHLNPAQYVLFIFGGLRRTARLLELNHSSILRWSRPKERNGTGGIIPSWHRHLILTLAQQWDLDITSHDLDFGRELQTETKNERHETQTFTPAREVLP